VQGGWKDYVRDAELDGVVRTGVKGQGQEWVEIRVSYKFTLYTLERKELM